jgi:PEP-CTERM motif
MRYWKSALGGIILAGSGTIAVPALAGDVTFDLGNIGANGGAVCSSGCVLPTNGLNTFSTMGLTIGAIGYDDTGAVKYVTQKPGSFEGPGETGIGESNVYNGPPLGNPPSSPDWEIEPNTYLLLDNALLTHGAKSVSITIESLQAGEGANVYSYSGPLGVLNPADLTLIGSVVGTPETQTVLTPDYTYLVVQGLNGDGNHPSADVAIATEVVTSGVPEASTWAMMMLGFAGLGFAGYRKVRAKAAFA